MVAATFDVEHGLSPGPLVFKDLKTRVKGGKQILKGINGRVEPGELLAVMGPSGAGKSTLLDALAGRRGPGATEGTITLGGRSKWDRHMTAYVEQEDALIGVLSVRETLRFAARLGLPRSTTKELIEQVVEETLHQLGLVGVKDNMIGTPIQRGISGGQKRRVSIGQSIVTKPRVLFLDEPTSGLDSATSKEVMSSIARTCKQQNTIVIATIHQPAWDTLLLFDKLLLLSDGRTVYSGRTDGLPSWLDSIGHKPDTHRNPSDVAMELVNPDFAPPEGGLNKLESPETKEEEATEGQEAVLPDDSMKRRRTDIVDHFRKTWILMHRNGLNYSRSLLSYGIRLGMYIGCGLLLATIWIRLGTDASKINDRLSVYFFGVAFLSFMSVAGIPSFLEERSVFLRERNNGLYTPFHYTIANSLVNLPFMFVCSLAFTLIMYWAVGLQSGASHFFRFLAFLFLAVYAAESQSLVFASFVPIFVAALALAAFANGFWMCVQGYFIRAVSLPRFWYYWAHWIDYETFAFNAIAKSDLTGLTFTCAGDVAAGTCNCPYTSSLVQQGVCAVTGQDVLKELQIDNTNYVLYGFILVIIIFVYRFLFWLGLTLRRR